MATDLLVNSKHPRNFTAEERRERFLAYKAKALAGEPIDADDTTWNEVDEPLTRQQCELLEDVLPKSGRYSPLLWLKLLEPGTDRVIRCRGRYDHISGAWFAGFSDVGNELSSECHRLGPYCQEVVFFRCERARCVAVASEANFMKELTYTYIDNSNFFIEGQRVAAVEAGMALDISDAIDRKVFDYSWQPDYGKLHALLCGEKKQIGSAKLWGSPPPADTFWKMVERRGFKVKTYERSYWEGEKGRCRHRIRSWERPSQDGQSNFRDCPGRGRQGFSSHRRGFDNGRI